VSDLGFSSTDTVSFDGMISIGIFLIVLFIISYLLRKKDSGVMIGKFFKQPNTLCEVKKQVLGNGDMLFEIKSENMTHLVLTTKSTSIILEQSELEKP